MNEELRIIIRAVTDEARKNIQSVRKELERMEETSQEASKTVDKAMSLVGKAALTAVGSVVALTTAITALGKRSLEFEKIQGQLVSGFQAVGLSAGQAAKTYDEFFGFLGEMDTAAEASNLLAKLTQEEQHLAEWTQILQGVFATFPDSIPIETLIESINEASKTGELVSAVEDAFNWAGYNSEEMQHQMLQANSEAEREAILRTTLNSLYGAAGQLYAYNNKHLIAYNKSQAALNRATSEAMRYITPMMTALNELASELLTSLKPAFETVAAVVIVFTQWIIAAIQGIAMFFGMFSDNAGSGTKTWLERLQESFENLSGASDDTGNSLKDTHDELEALKRATMGFDELNVVSLQTGFHTKSNYADTSKAYEGILSPDAISQLALPNIDDFEQKIEKVREAMKGIAVLVGAIGAGLAVWKIIDFTSELKDAKETLDFVLEYMDKRKSYIGEDWEADYNTARKDVENLINPLKKAGGFALAAAGAMLLVSGYSDAWVNGIDWGNFAMVLGGIALIVGGITLAFGPLAGAIALAIGGVVAIVIAIKDMITNGVNLQNMLTAIIGVIAVATGVILALNVAGIAASWWIVAIVAGIALLVGGFILLWNNCEGFRNFWINLWEKVKAVFAKFVKSLEPLWESIKSAFKSAGEFIAVIWQGISGEAGHAWEAIKLIWDVVGPYFKTIWENIKVLFTFGAEFMGAKLKLAWEIIKITWNQVVSYFKAIFDSISAIFDIFTAAFKGDWQGVSDAVKRLVGTWGDFFKNTFENIKKIIGAVGTYFTSVFSSSWEAIKKILSNFKSFFQGWGSTISDALGSAIKSSINYVLRQAVGLINGFISAINTAISVINAIPGVNIKTLNKLDVPKLATGGIVSGATLAMVGERGREAVLPLENNTGWMDALAERIAAKNSSPSRIVLQVGEKELGYAVINSINGITRQTGKLQLVY